MDTISQNLENNLQPKLKNNNKRNFLIFILIILLLAGLFFIYRKYSNIKKDNTPLTEEQTIELLNELKTLEPAINEGAKEKILEGMSNDSIKIERNEEEIKNALRLLTQ